MLFREESDIVLVVKVKCTVIYIFYRDLNIIPTNTTVLFTSNISSYCRSVAVSTILATMLPLIRFDNLKP